MKKKSNPKKKKTNINQVNISEIFCKYAEDYITLGKDINETRNYLHFACVAWNLSLYPEPEMKEKLDLVISEYEKLNFSTINADHLRHDMEILIQKKIKKHPNIHRLITKISVEETGDSYKIATESSEFASRNIK